jgi:hypothetical protein
MFVSPLSSGARLLKLLPGFFELVITLSSRMREANFDNSVGDFEN